MTEKFLAEPETEAGSRGRDERAGDGGAAALGGGMTGTIRPAGLGGLQSTPEGASPADPNNVSRHDSSRRFADGSTEEPEPAGERLNPSVPGVMGPEDASSGDGVGGGGVADDRRGARFVPIEDDPEDS